LFSSDEGAEPDFVQAEIWARRAAEAESADGQAVLAFILSAGPKALRNEAKAVSWYHLSASSGSPQGDLGYGPSLLRSANGRRDKERKAAEHISRAAKADWLGVLTEGGTGTERDLAVAAQLYRRVAALGHRSAQANWGRALMAGMGVDPNPTEGETWLRRAAFAGDPEAATATSMPPTTSFRPTLRRRHSGFAGQRRPATQWRRECLNGAGTPRDPKEAARWLRIATDAGDGRLRATALVGNLEPAGIFVEGMLRAKRRRHHLFDFRRHRIRHAAIAEQIVAPQPLLAGERQTVADHTREDWIAFGLPPDDPRGGVRWGWDPEHWWQGPIPRPQPKPGSTQPIRKPSTGR
jgi:TPR repeat protein